MIQPLGSQYELHELLGRGAMGQVFRGVVRHSGAPVAVKVLKPELVSDTEVVARFFRERSILTSISHPNVAKVLDLVVEGDTLGIVMELVEGQDLRRYLRQRGTLPPAEAVRLMCQLLCGLAAVHAAGIVHRDVKPENLLLSTARGLGELKLTDFGVSRLSYGVSLTRMTSLIGTPEYMAPELADHDRATAAADLYSAGIVLYEVLAGRTPFVGGHPLAVLRRQLDQPPPPVPGLPGELWAQVDGLLSKDPRSRPASAEAALALLEPLLPLLSGLPALPPQAASSRAGPAIPAWSAVPAGRGPSGPLRGPDQPAQATVLRHRDRSVAGAEGVPAMGKRSRGRTRTAPAGRRARPRWSWLHAWPVTLSLAAAVAVLATVLGLQNARSAPAAPPAPSAGQPDPAVGYSFPAQRYAQGLVVTRRWALAGRKGSELTETLTASSATGQALTAWFKESIPAAIASTTKTLRFTSVPVRVVRRDPVVEWYLRLPAHGTITIGYVATVPPDGATAARLAAWAKGLDDTEKRLNPAPGRSSESASPAALSPAANPPAEPPATSTPPASATDNPNPWPTYSCDPTVVTCTPVSGGGF